MVLSAFFPCPMNTFLFSQIEFYTSLPNIKVPIENRRDDPLRKGVNRRTYNTMVKRMMVLNTPVTTTNYTDMVYYKY
jgi:hypothetical protein